MLVRLGKDGWVDMVIPTHSSLWRGGKAISLPIVELNGRRGLWWLVMPVRFMRALKDGLHLPNDAVSIPACQMSVRRPAGWPREGHDIQFHLL